MIYEDQYFRTVEDCRSTIAILTINSKKYFFQSSFFIFYFNFFLSLSIEKVVESVEFVRIRR